MQAPGFAERGRAALGLALAGLTAGLLVKFSLVSPAPEPARHHPRIVMDSSTLVPGDLVFRRGRSMISRAVLSLDGESEFSHVAIAVSIANQIRVVHAIPPEGTDSGGVIEEPLESFLIPELASAAALYRPKDAAVGTRAAATALRYARARTPFDSGFDLSTPDAMYCTELVWRAYLEAGADLIGGFHERYLLPSRLLMSPEFRLIKEYKEEEIP